MSEPDCPGAMMMVRGEDGAITFITRRRRDVLYSGLSPAQAIAEMEGVSATAKLAAQPSNN